MGALGVLWVGLLAGGLLGVTAYGAAPGAAPGTAAEVGATLDWPEALAPIAGGLAQDGSDAGSHDPGVVLVIAVHPKCPCTRASAAELVRVLDRPAIRARVDEGLIRLVVLERLPTDTDGVGSDRSAARDAWRGGDAVRRLMGVPGTVVIEDPGGTIAARMGARTSGHVFAVSPEGTVLFSGGVTATRGHEGTSPGGDALRRVLDGSGLGTRDRAAPVFGCPLRDESEALDGNGDTNGDACPLGGCPVGGEPSRGG